MEHLTSLQNYEGIKHKIRTNTEWLLLISQELDTRVPTQSVLTDEGITYIADSRDTVIPMMMYHTGENWAKEEIDFFFKSTSGDYCKATGGIFIDIGANIGTTSIYVKEKVPGLKVIGFEPGRENFDLFRANIIMNRMDGVTAEWMGLSDENGGRIIAIFRLIQEEVIYRRVRQLRRMT